MIPQHIIDQILQIPISDTIGKRVRLKKAGTVFEACCPFHKEKTPSFKVFPKTNSFKCFGCGEGGNAVSFLMKYEGLNFPEACEHLAKDHGIDIPREEQSEEDKAKYNHREALFLVNQMAMEYFRSNLYKEETPLGLEYVRDRWYDESIQSFDLGYAPDMWQGLFNWAKEKGIKTQILIEAGLIREGQGGKLYDYFRDRLIFPIHNRYGRIVGFTGRDFNGKQKAKYLNTPETDIYHKGETLYGIQLAAHTIKEKGFAYLVEGNADVIRMHQIGITNTVCSSGTALTPAQIGILSKLTDSITLIFDSDQAGKNATNRSAKLIIKQGIPCNVISLPGDKGKMDPDSFFTSNTQFKEYAKSMIIDYIIARTKYWEIKANATDFKIKAIDEISALIVEMSDGAQQVYIEQVGKIIKPVKLWNDKIKELKKEREPKVETQPIPKHVSLSDFDKFGFYEDHNCYYFKTRTGIIRGSNFILKPLFHIKSVINAKRLFEITNEHGYMEVIELAQRDLVGLARFRECIESLGNFLWEASEIELTRLKRVLYEKTDTCIEIIQLGWQKEGFFAWGNGLFNGKFTEVDANGIAQFDETKYYLPAFSNIYQGEQGLFQNERKFIHRQGGSISFNDYAAKLISVFGKNAQIAICFYIASLFRDFIIQRFTFFPILNLFGPKGAGKTELAISLMHFFGKQGKGPNINNTTKAALADHVSQVSNACMHIDEYRNDIDIEKVEFLKGVWDGTGRSRMNMDKDKKKETTAVDCALILSGQQMPTADIALFSRMIYLTFHQTKYSDEEKARFDDLKAIEKAGLTHITHEILVHRKYFLSQYMSQYDLVAKDLNIALKGEKVEDRVFRNWLLPLAAYATLEDKITLPFTYEDLINHAAAQLQVQSVETDKGNEVSTFWSIVQYLFADGLIQEDVDYKLKGMTMLSTDKGDLHWNNPKSVLIIQHSRIFMLYRKHGKSAGEKILPTDSIDYYLKNSQQYLGRIRGTRFTAIDKNGMPITKTKIDKKLGIEISVPQTKVNTGYAFLYDDLDISITTTDSEFFPESKKADYDNIRQLDVF